jgi:hypothetical protein
MTEKTKEFIVKMFRLAIKHFWKIIVIILLFGFLFASCEIPTPFGVIKKGGIELPFK